MDLPITLEARCAYLFALGEAKDILEMLSFSGRFRPEAQSLFCEAQTLHELAQMAEKRIVYYNAARRHSSLNHVAPRSLIKDIGVAANS